MRRLLLACVLQICLAGGAAAQGPRVVADIAPVHALVASVMRGAGAPDLLLDADTDPHHVQLRPSQARALAGADLLVWMGPGLTPWLADLRASLAPDSASLALLDLPDPPIQLEGPHGHDHEVEAPDPHAWLDPLTAAFYLPAIAEALSRIDPGNAALYTANAQDAAARLAALEAELRPLLARLQGVPMVAYHDAYRYLFHRFGLSLAGHITDVDGAAPGAAGLRALGARLSENPGKACVLIEPGQNPGLIDALLPEGGYRLAELDIHGAGLPAGPERYEAMLRGVAATLEGCAAPEG